MSQTDFSSLNLRPELVSNLDTLGYTEMTPIQAQSLPSILEGKDVIGQGKTGSGKTAAFGLGLLQRLNVERFRIQTLVLCPTRELADQVAKEIRKLARGIHNIKVLTLCGGMPFGPQIGSLEHGAHIIVGTPGRVLDHLTKGTLRLDNLTTFVLDEADRMLEMGFQDALDAIVEKAPSDRQTLLFSATFPKKIQAIAAKIMNNPEMVEVASTHDDSTIKQHFYKVKNFGERLDTVRGLLLLHKPESTVIFCNTKKDVQDVADELGHFGFSVIALHGDLEQRDRDQALVRFSNKSISVMVATDVASRGLDIESLDAVINFQVSHDSEIHVHRIGRTGRAGSKGMAYTIFDEKEAYQVALLEDRFGMITPEALPPMSVLNESPMTPQMECIRIDGGKKQKVRAGDILGALTGKDGIDGKLVGKIQLFDNCAYVAVDTKVAKAAVQKIGKGKLKGRMFRAWIVRSFND
ncbi:ATP-dependent RNA helicase DbpA [Moritella yayanosii]|uniref:DEAD-box ATP-dependent RNA helicase RhpA n=1 Tax=Moritella yayanosii TaxID=69539 RepID=A0A330LV49_9GAMM|nr:ATP-dependent RNA helicase DbpA [Moritella yayanosii]SQD80629.1 ATP-dependent RNA helicase, specific for 23S rRNA [Moritella yayanosii]